MNTCQFIVLCAAVAVSAAENWTGALADHKLGQLVADTPEVAAAKRQHALAFMQIRSLFPATRPEESEEYFVAEEEPFIPQIQPQHHQHHLDVHNIPEDSVTQAPWKGPFADHVLGQQVKETPAVAAARKHHEEVYSKVRAVLPELPSEEDEGTKVVPQVVPVRSVFPQVRPAHHEVAPQVHQADVHDIEAAREAHVKAVMERIALLNSLHSKVPSTTPEPAVESLHSSEFVAARVQHAKAIAALLGYQ